MPAPDQTNEELHHDAEPKRVFFFSCARAGAGTPIPGLYACGDSCMPGIGVPAAAASGMIAANTLAPVWSHLKLLDALAL